MEIEANHYQVAQKLSEVCSNVFSLILHLRASDDFGEPNTLRSKVITLFDSMKNKGKELGIDEEELNEAQYALVAFLDETIANSSWIKKDEWLARRLALELFNTVNAGDEYFTKLEQLQQQGTSKASLLEVYYLCLVLGFEGKYKILGKEKLKTVVIEIAKDLKLAKLAESNELSPRWKRSHEIIRAVPISGIPFWLVLIFCLTVGIIIFFKASSKIDTFATHVRSQIISFIKE